MGGRGNKASPDQGTEDDQKGEEDDEDAMEEDEDNSKAVEPKESSKASKSAAFKNTTRRSGRKR